MTDELRNQLVPLNKKYPIAELLDACRNYPGSSNARRITFEYVMLKGVNDSPAEARELVRLLKGIPAKVNLIPFNPWPGAPYECSTDAAIKAFSDIVFAAGYSAPVRTPRGRDISAACGQLKSLSVRARRTAPGRCRPRQPRSHPASLPARLSRCVSGLARRDRRRRLSGGASPTSISTSGSCCIFPDRSRPQLGELGRLGVREVQLTTADGLDVARPGICRRQRASGRSSSISTAMAATSATAPTGSSALPAKATAC